VRAFRDRFFVHVYTDVPTPGKPQDYLNRDFDVTSVPLRHVGASTPGAARCAIDRPFGSSVPAEVVFGQFQTPKGSCCTILWSRDMILQEQ
jgi:hypothetical protein